MATKIYEVAICADPERVIGIKEMGTEDLLRAFQLAGQDANEQAANMRTKLMALRLCVVEDNGKKVAYADLQGELWDQRFSMRESMLLMTVWAKIHEPSREDVEGLGGLLRVKSGG